MGLNGTEFVSAQRYSQPQDRRASHNESRTLLVIDAFPRKGTSMDGYATHARNVRSACSALLESMFQAQSVLLQRDRFDVVAVSVENRVECGEDFVRIAPIIESNALRDPRNQRSSVGRLNLALRPQQFYDANYDSRIFASSLFSEICASTAAIFEEEPFVSNVNVTLLTSCTIASHLSERMKFGASHRGSSVFPNLSRKRTVLRVLGMGKASDFGNCAASRTDRICEDFSCLFVPNNVNAMCSILRSVLGDVLESSVRFLIDVCGESMVEMELYARPRVLCSIGTGCIYSSRVGLPARLTLEGVHRISVASLSEDVLYGVSHIIVSNYGHATLGQLVRELRNAQECLLVRVVAAAPFRSRFAVVIPCRTADYDALLLRDVACASTFVPLRIGCWIEQQNGNRDGGAGADHAHEQTHIGTALQGLARTVYVPADLSGAAYP